MFQTSPTYGISVEIDVNVDALSPLSPIEFVSDASKAGLYVKFYVMGGILWAKVAGSVDELQDFQITL